MKELKKLTKETLTRDEMRNVAGGFISAFDGDDCGDGKFNCTCNGTDYGCVSSAQECWDKC